MHRRLRTSFDLLVVLSRGGDVNEKQLHLIQGVMDSINATLKHYENDQAFAPADWILENWWNTLSVAITSSSPSEEA